MAQFSAFIAETELQTKRTIRHRFRAGIFHAWDHQCAYCGDPAKSLDHIRPKAKGGLNVASNLAPACFSCNLSKSSDDWTDWFRRQAFWSIERENAIARWHHCGLPDNEQQIAS
jgi:5-methylcytosine-specific restriction endonuclease McrA